MPKRSVGETALDQGGLTELRLVGSGMGETRHVTAEIAGGVGETRHVTAEIAVRDPVDRANPSRGNGRPISKKTGRRIGIVLCTGLDVPDIQSRGSEDSAPAPGAPTCPDVP